MHIKELAKVPKLVEVVLDDPDIVEKYGEPITFYTRDVIGMSTYFDFFNARSDNQYEYLEKMIKKLILDEQGNPVLADDEDLPVDIGAAALNKLGEMMGKSLSKTSTPSHTEQPV